MSKIVFSAIGTTDPVRNFHDGAWLHCLRWEHPEKTFIYLTHQMNDYEEKYHFYSEALDLLNRELEEEGKTPVQLEIIRRPELTDPHVYGNLYADITEILTGIHEDNPDVEIVVNCSSGTPVIKQCLSDMRILLPFGKEMRFLQVNAPNDGRDYKEGRVDENYNLQENWECDDDRKPDSVCRTIPMSPDQHDLLIRSEYAKILIRQHEYHAAFLMMEDDLSMFTKGEALGKALKAADQRKMLQLVTAGANLNAAGVPNDKLQSEAGSGKRQCAEMLLTMMQDLQSHDYANMLRKITPFLFGLAIEYIRDHFHLDMESYMIPEGRANAGKFEWARFEKEQAKHAETIRKALGIYPTSGYLTLHIMLPVIAKGEKEIRDGFETLRKNVEEPARNDAAHRLVGIGEGWIKSKTGMTPETIIGKCKTLLRKIAPGYGNVFWDSYERMDEAICDMFVLKQTK